MGISPCFTVCFRRPPPFLPPSILSYPSHALLAHPQGTKTDQGLRGVLKVDFQEAALALDGDIDGVQAVQFKRNLLRVLLDVPGREDDRHVHGLVGFQHGRFRFDFQKRKFLKQTIKAEKRAGSNRASKRAEKEMT